MDKKEMLELLESPSLETLVKEADTVRRHNVGDKVYIRGIIEFSNFCIRNCLYCGLRRDNKSVKRYRMNVEEIVDAASRIVSLGIKTVVLQSGDDPFYTQGMVCRAIENIKEMGDVAVTLSIGERKLEDYKAFREAGADRYLLKHETVNEGLYTLLHPGQSLRDRLKILTYLRSIGYQIGSGNIVGLPYQRLEDIVDDIIFLRNLKVDMAGIGPFIPQKDTPLGNCKPGDIELTLKTLALARINMPWVHLPATTAVATLDPLSGIRRALGAGCNVIMPNFTPEVCAKNYTIYDSKVVVTLEEVKRVVTELGREISLERGDSLLDL